MIYDRMCKGGGWNYGNSKVLDYALWPYPDITAVALIALQDRAGEQANQESLRGLRKTADEANSGLAASWAAICLGVYGQDDGTGKSALRSGFAKPVFSAKQRHSRSHCSRLTANPIHFGSKAMLRRDLLKYSALGALYPLVAGCDRSPKWQRDAYRKKDNSRVAILCRDPL